MLAKTTYATKITALPSIVHLLFAIVYNAPEHVSELLDRFNLYATRYSTKTHYPLSLSKEKWQKFEKDFLIPSYDQGRTFIKYTSYKAGVHIKWRKIIPYRR